MASTSDDVVVVRVFANVPVGKRRSDGFVNATAACQACHKEFSNYYRLEGTTEYVAALARHTGKNVRELIESSRGCRGGTWVHPSIALDLGRWLSKDFAIWMDSWFIEEMLRPATENALPPRSSDIPAAQRPPSFDGFSHNALPAIRTEADLQAAVVHRIRKDHPGLLLVAGMPCMPNPDHRAIHIQLGYTLGQPDLMIPAKSGSDVGLAIEFKAPCSDAEHLNLETSFPQDRWLEVLEQQGWRTLVTNDIVAAMRVVDEFASNLWVLCDCGCATLFRTTKLVEQHKSRKRKFEETEAATAAAGAQ